MKAKQFPTKGIRLATEVIHELRSVSLATGRDPKAVLEELAKKWTKEEKKKVAEKWTKAG